MPLPSTLITARHRDLDLRLLSGAWPDDVAGEVFLSAPEPSARLASALFGFGVMIRLSLRPGTHGAPADRFAWLRGQDQIDSFKVPEAERFTQSFCRTCGSKTPRVNTQMGYVAIPAGSLDDDPGGRPQSHIFVGSKAPWFPITDTLPQFPEYPG